MIVTKGEALSVIENSMKGVKDAFDKETEASWNAKVSTMVPGTPLPKKGTFYDDASKERYNSKVAVLQEQAEKKLKEYLDGVHMATVTEPSEQALRSIQMFSMIDPKTLDKAEYSSRINDLMGKYGDNALAYESLRSLAISAGINDFGVHPAIMQMRSVDSVKGNVHSFFEGSKAYGFHDSDLVNDARVAFTMMMIKQDAGVIKD